MSTLDQLDANEHDPDGPEAYTVADSPGIAWHYAGRETAPDADTEWTGYEVETGRALMVMVGDDQRHSIDPDDVEPCADYCAGCGQIGCTADGRERG